MTGDLIPANVLAVSYTHLDVYKRQSPDRPACLGAPCDVRILGGSEFRLRKISALRRFYGHAPAPQSGGPVVEVPK